MELLYLLFPILLLTTSVTSRKGWQTTWPTLEAKGATPTPVQTPAPDQTSAARRIKFTKPKPQPTSQALSRELCKPCVDFMTTCIGERRAAGAVVGPAVFKNCLRDLCFGDQGDRMRRCKAGGRCRNTYRCPFMEDGWFGHPLIRTDEDEAWFRGMVDDILDEHLASHPDAKAELAGVDVAELLARRLLV